MSHVVCIVYSLLSIIQYGSTALRLASYYGHTEVVTVLVEAKADLNITYQVNLMINIYLHSLISIDVHTYQPSRFRGIIPGLGWQSRAPDK